MRKWKIPWPGQWTKKRKIFHKSLLYSSRDFIVSMTLVFTTVLLCLLLRSVDSNSDTSYLAVIFKRETGQTITEFILSRRVEAAKSLISGGIRLSEIAEMLGFSSQSHFCRCFKEVTGVTPGEFRDKGI